MSTANFYSMENFSLYALLNEQFMEKDEEENPYFDEFAMQDVIDEADNTITDLNDDLTFHEISLKSGYYDGVQIYITEKYDSLEYIKKNWTNEDCKYEFDLCKSITLRKFQIEINKINKKIKKIAQEYGFIQLEVTARFSNGETWYSKVS